MEEIVKKLHNDALVVKAKRKVSVDVYPSGVVDVDHLFDLKKDLFDEAVSYTIDSVVKHDVLGYPKDGVVASELKLDAVILPSKLYYALLNLLDKDE